MPKNNSSFDLSKGFYIFQISQVASRVYISKKKKKNKF